MSQIKDIVASCQPTSSEKAGAGAGLPLNYFLRSRGGGEQKFLALLPGGTLLLVEDLKLQQQPGTALGAAGKQIDSCP